MPEFLHSPARIQKRIMTGKFKILVVEDQPAVAMMMTYALTLAGCDVCTALTGKKGLEIANSDDFDVITLDLTLPDISGFDLCEKLKSNSCSYDTPVVIVSGNDSKDHRRRAHELGAADFIAKPFDAGDFVDRIFKNIGESAPA